jgi:hypothetical protein
MLSSLNLETCGHRKRCHLCPSQKYCRVSGLNWWSNEPPLDTEIAVLPKRSADGNTIDGGLGVAAQDGLVGDSSSSAFLLTVAIDGGV